MVEVQASLWVRSLAVGVALSAMASLSGCADAADLNHLSAAGKGFAAAAGLSVVEVTDTADDPQVLFDDPATYVVVSATAESTPRRTVEALVDAASDAGLVVVSVSETPGYHYVELRGPDLRLVVSVDAGSQYPTSVRLAVQPV